MQIKNLSMSFGNYELFKNVNLYIDDNQKIGVVGVNGAGKTTFFKIIMGKIEPDAGKVILGNRRVSWLPQVLSDDNFSMDISVFDFLLSGRPIDKINDELQWQYEKVSKELDENKQQKIFNKIEKLQKKLDYWEFLSAESTLLKIIDGMKIDDGLLDKKLSELSGGQKSKIAFARLLYSKPEIILLDEPTNHLDKDTKDYVINYLKNYRGSVFVISHDIDFLNEVTTMTLFLNKGKKTFELYEGNYDRFKKLNDEQEKALEQQIKKEQMEEDKLKAFINKYASSSGKRKKMVQDREKKLEKLNKNKTINVFLEKQAKMEIVMNRESSKIPLKVNHLCFKYDQNDEKNLINNLSFSLYRGEKFLIVGKNGVGKSTLLKLIIGKLKPNSGDIDIGKKTDIGYYAQEHELLDSKKSIIDNFAEINISQAKLRSVLGRFLFYGDDVFKMVGVLSPGERSRVALAKLSLSGANFLILDEPTNHLDPKTQAIIAETFKEFPGTMLVVSHNLEFVDNLGIERTLVLPDGKISYYDRQVLEYYSELNKK